MDTADLIDRLETEGARLADAAAQADPGARVPGLRWNVEQLLRHTGGVHRWVDDLLRERALVVDTAGELIDSGPREAAQVAQWFTDGLTELTATLREVAPDLVVPTLMKTPSPVHFWARRQAHETAIHRADAEASIGRPTPIDAEFAQDGIAELLQGFARGRGFAVDTQAVLLLEATDGPSWTITFGGERIESIPTADPKDAPRADATVHAASCELYRWVWNRPADAKVAGDPGVAALWAAAVQIRRG